MTDRGNMRIRRRKRILRERKAKRMGARFITVLTALLIILTVAGSISSFAGSKSPLSTTAFGENLSAGIKPEKQYTSIMVYPGDSLYSVAESCMCPDQNNRERLMKEIAAINHLSPDNGLTAGNHIIVPVYR
ncbi:MAG: hypothetical protein K5668_05710 [Lachnospiraceae bacterium]|nr:hypothetical protein [Lachnospiraceae bacterium]